MCPFLISTLIAASMQLTGKTQYLGIIGREKVQRAKLRGPSLRAIAREMGTHRNTLGKYALAACPRIRF